MIYTYVSGATHNAHALVARAHNIRAIPDGTQLPVLLVPSVGVRGLGGVCAIDKILSERITLRKLGISFSVGDILRLAGSYFGFKVVTPAQICETAIDVIEDALVAALNKLVKTAMESVGFDCSKNQLNDWKDWLRAVGTNLQLSGSNYGLSISVDWAGLGAEFMQFVLCAAMNKIVAFAASIASDISAIADKLKSVCNSCVGATKAPVVSTTQALTQAVTQAVTLPPRVTNLSLHPGLLPDATESVPGYSGGYGRADTTNYVGIGIVATVTVAGAYWIWRKRRKGR